MADLTFSLFHPTGRPCDWMRAAQRFRDAADNPERCEYVLGIHRHIGQIDPTIDFRYQYQFCRERLMEIWPDRWILSVNIGPPNVVQSASACVVNCSAKILIAIGDWLRPCEHWDTELLKVITDPEKPQLVAVSHGTYLPDTWIVTYGIFTRALVEKYGYVAWPEYTHYGVDDDLTLMAKRDDLIVEAKHLCFPYLHWSNQKRVPDDLDRHTKASGAWETKERVLKKRIDSNFSGKVVYGCIPINVVE